MTELPDSYEGPLSRKDRNNPKKLAAAAKRLTKLAKERREAEQAALTPPEPPPPPPPPRVPLPPGAPTVLTQEKEDLFMEAVSQGNFFVTAAVISGLNPLTVKDWLKDGRREWESENPNVESRAYKFFVRAQHTVACTEAFAAARILNSGDWKALSWWLERGPARERWRPETKVTGRVEVNLQSQIQERMGMLSDTQMIEETVRLESMLSLVAGDDGVYHLPT